MTPLKCPRAATMQVTFCLLMLAAMAWPTVAAAGSASSSSIKIHNRKLQQPGWGGFSGCASKPLVIAHGGTPPANIDDLINDMQSPLTKVDVVTYTVFQKIVDQKLVEFINLNDPNSCIRGLTTVRGALVIYDDGTINSLPALAALKTVQGPFFIYGVAGKSSLTTLEGLDNLQQVGGLNIAHMRQLQHLNSLGKLTVNQGDLVVLDNSVLTSLAGLGGFNQMFGRLWIDNNPLVDLRGLDLLQTIDGDVVIRNLPNLTSLAGLRSLTGSTRGELLMSNLPRIQTTRELGNFSTVGISVVIENMPQLEDLACLARLRTVPGDLQLYRLPRLQSLDGLANLQTVGLNLVLGVNDNLASLAGLGNLRGVGTSLSIANNPKLTTLKGLGNIQIIGQDLDIRGNNALQSLADLPTSLRSIGAFRGAYVVIQNNPQLATLAGLGSKPGLLIYGAVMVSDNPQLPAAEVQALQAKATPMPITIETVYGQVPADGNASAPTPMAAAGSTPATTAGAPNATAGAPNATAGAPNATAGAPNATAGAPNATAGATPAVPAAAPPAQAPAATAVVAPAAPTAAVSAVPDAAPLPGATTGVTSPAATG